MKHNYALIIILYEYGNIDIIFQVIMIRIDENDFQNGQLCKYYHINFTNNAI